MTKRIGQRAAVVAMMAGLCGGVRLPLRPLTRGGAQRCANESVAVAVVRDSSACCRLTGRWDLFLVLDSAALGEKRVLARQLSAGMLTFTDSASLFANRSWHDTEQVRRETGVAVLDLSPMLGEEYRPGELTRWIKSMDPEVEPSMEREVLATTFPSDSVEIDTPAAVDHFGLILDGRISGDSITGRWFQKKFCCGASGHFLLRRRR